MIHFEEITLIDAPIERVFDLSRSIEVHLLANVHENEQALAMGGVTTGLLGLGEQVTWRAKHFGLWHDLTSRATVVNPPTYFQVTMVEGIFRSMQAGHLLRSLPSGATELRDTFAIAAPLPILGPIAEALFLRRYMIALNRERNAVIKQLAESDDWRRYVPAQRLERNP
jgi:ligand-binding SRPBCC domain-containing protein